MGIQINGNTDTISAIDGGLIVSGADFTGVSAGTTAAPSISPTGDSNTGIFFPSADTIAIAEGGVEALRINSSGNLGIGTTNPTTTLQVNGTTKVETSIGSTQSVWFDTLDSKSLSANNVSLLVQPENAYFHNSSLSSRDYYPVVVSTALTTNNVSNFGALYGITNLANVAGTASTARVYGVGSYNFLARNSTTDVSSYASNQLYGQLNNVVQGTNVDASVVTGFAINFTNQTIIQKGTATNIIGNYQVISVGNVPNNSANSTSAFNFSAFSVAGASSGTGIGTITDLYSYYANALILSTGRVSNYYGLYLNSPSVFGGTLSNRYSIFSNDASSRMYHAGSIGIGITNSSSKLQVQGTIGLGASDDLESGFSGGRTKLTSSASGFVINHNDNSATIFQNQGTERVRIDSIGRVTTPYQVAFHVPKITSDTITTTAAKLSFGTATYDVGSNYSDANDRFTAPVAGKYFFYAAINVINSGNNVSISIRKNGGLYGQIFYAATNFPRMDFNPVGIIDLTASDYVEIYSVINTGTTTIDNAGYFGGYLLG